MVGGAVKGQPFVGGVAASLTSALLWGCYPVFARYIQTREDGRPSAVALLSCLTTLDGTLLALYLALCSRTMRSDDWQRRARFAAGYGLLCLTRMFTNMQSTRWTDAVNIQVTALLTPFVTSAMARVLLNERLHAALAPTLAATLLGSLFALGAFSTARRAVASAAGHQPFGWWDVAGISLQLVSVVLSSAVKIYLKASEGVLSKAELMAAQMITTAVPTSVVAASHDMPSLRAIARMDATGWACFWGLSFGVYLAANLLQITATRALGASNHTVSNSLRLVSACLGSWLLLNEPVDDPWRWLGLAIIVAALISFWVVQQRTQAKHICGRSVTVAGTLKPVPLAHNQADPDPEAHTPTQAACVNVKQKGGYGMVGEH